MIRRISTKWALGVLAAVVVPFAGFAIVVSTKIADRAGDVVRYHLLRMAGDLADKIDEEVVERRLDAEILASNPMIEWWVGDPGGPDSDGFLYYVQRTLDLLVESSDVYDFVLAIDAEGRYAASNNLDATGSPLSQATLDLLVSTSYADEPWFRQTMEQGEALIPWHLSPFVDDGQPAFSRHHIGFVHRIDSSGAEDAPPIGVICILMNWRHIQARVEGIDSISGKGADREEGVDESSYAWIWRSEYAYGWVWESDADTILAHPNKGLYGTRVSEPPIELPQLVSAARKTDWDMYPEYSFDGVEKSAAFKHCRGPADQGFGWVVGVGVDNADIYEPVDELSALLYTASSVVLALAVLWTFFMARRTTRPILALQQHTKRIAAGDLDARIDVHTNDELGDLAGSLNRMSGELKENREQLVRAEKDAAWREMARQVAHEIKNPLTPIRLSTSLLKRSHDERSPEFERIFERTIDLIQRQVENMREIASDFNAFAGEHRAPETFDLGELVDEVIELHAAWAAALGVSVQRVPGSGTVHADPNELRRAIINLVTNALEAMPDGGELTASVRTTGDEVELEVRDSGHGLSEEIQGRLFEPYFTTRSSGTGLGLAIVRRVVEDMGGRFTLENAEPAGALARVVLPEGLGVTRVLVTGATGFVGSALVEELLEHGYSVHVLAREGSPREVLAGRDVVWHAGDLTSATSLASAIKAAARGTEALDLVHCAAVISYRSGDRALQQAVNVDGTRAVLEAAAGAGVRRAVHVSSVVAVGHARGSEELDEEAPFNGHELGVDYVTTKYAAETVALGLTARLDVRVVNPGAVFGPFGRESNSLRFLRSVATGSCGPLAPPGGLSVVGVRDTAVGIRLALERGRRGRRYLLTESFLTMSELFRQVAAGLDVRPVRGVVPRPLWRTFIRGTRLLERFRELELATPQALRMVGVDFRFSSERARRELGWRPRPFGVVLEETIAELRARGLLPTGPAPSGG